MNALRGTHYMVQESLLLKRDNSRDLSPQVQRVQFDPMLHDLAANQAKGITSCGSKLLLDTG